MVDAVRSPREIRKAAQDKNVSKTQGSSPTCHVSHHGDYVATVDPNFARILDQIRALDLDGPPDPRERMSATGVRIPDPGTELPPRAHYENAFAADYARRGFTHFAELIEAGHGCTACHLTHFVNRPPSNAELDLARYAAVAKATKTAREVVETYAFASMSASAEMARRLQGPAKISIVNVADELDPLLAREFSRHVAENPVAYRSYQQLLKNGTEVIVDFGEPIFPGKAGVALPYQNRVIIFARNHTSAKEMASTLAHEAQHMQRVFRGLRVNTQLDEYRSALREFVFEKARRPTASERLAIRARIAREYAELPRE